MVDWKAKGREALARLIAARHGEREEILQSVAGRLNVHTVRRWVTAVRYLDRLAKEAPEVWKALEESGTSFSEIEVLARWAEHDARGSLEAARRAARGEYSSRTLKTAMLEALRGEASERSESSDFAYRKRMESAARERIASLLGLKLGPPSMWSKDTGDIPADFLYLTVGESGSVMFVAGLVVGPYTVAHTYIKRRFEWIARAFALAWCYDVVVIVLPNSDALPQYEGAIRSLEQRAASAAARRTAGPKDSPCLPRVHVLYQRPTGSEKRERTA